MIALGPKHGRAARCTAKLGATICGPSHWAWFRSTLNGSDGRERINAALTGSCLALKTGRVIDTMRFRWFRNCVGRDRS